MADEARTQRQKALADKKKRLEELKARRSQRGTQTGTAREAARQKVDAVKNLDAYIDGLLKVPAGGAQAPPLTPNNAAQPTSAGPAANGTAHQEPATTPSENHVYAVPAPVAPVIKSETFEAGTQTIDDDFPPPSDYDGEEEQQEEEEEKGYETSPELPQHEEEEVEDEAKVLTAEEVEQELASDTFSSFLNIASKKVERVLNSAVLADLLVDYDGETNGQKRSRASDGSKFLGSRQVYECPQWTQNRDVTDMDWSPLHTELMLCGYHMSSTSPSLGQPIGSTAVKNVSPDDTPSDSLAPRRGELLSDGLALVWNLALPNRPEHIFTCGSPVTTVRFHPTESPLIIGGCQSGQVVVWDVRAGRMPVQKSSLVTTSSGNSKGHTHPICAMQVVEGGVSVFYLFFIDR
jgi:dynein intermediate chain